MFNKFVIINKIEVVDRKTGTRMTQMQATRIREDFFKIILISFWKQLNVTTHVTILPSRYFRISF
jgi:hypothetical protein